MSAELEFKTVFEPAVVTPPVKPEVAETSEIPKLKYDSTKDVFKGDRLRDGTDCFPIIIKGISVAKGDQEPWYLGSGLCVRLETYGGGISVQSKNENVEEDSDLCCLFHSCGKSLLPELAHVSLQYTSKNDQVSSSHAICHNFKAALTTYCLSDTAEGQENKRASLERDIKLRYTFSSGKRVNLFVEDIKTRLLEEKKTPQQYAEECYNAISQRGALITDINHLRSQKRMAADADTRAAIKVQLTDMKSTLLSPELPYNKIMKYVEASLLDPRFDMINGSTTGGVYKQYFWPPEIRALPLTMGLFTSMALFEYNEWDIREEDLGGATAPTGGRIKLQTIIDQLLAKMMYGIDYFRFIAMVTGFSIFLITRSGEPHTQHFVTRLPISDQIIESVAAKLLDIKAEYSGKEYDEEAPCIVICFESSHFESVALLHELPVQESKKSVFQAQSVFSFYDPFIQSIINRHTTSLSPSAKAPIPVKIPKLSVGPATPLRTPKPKAQVEEKEREVDITSMSVDELMKFWDRTQKGWQDNVKAVGGNPREQAVATLNAAKAKRKEEVKKESQTKKEEGETEQKEVDIGNMTVKNLMAYWDDTQEGWRDNVIASGQNPEDYARAEKDAAKAKNKPKPIIKPVIRPVTKPNK